MCLSGNQVLFGSPSRRSYKAVFWYPAGCSTSIIALTQTSPSKAYPLKNLSSAATRGVGLASQVDTEGLWSSFLGWVRSQSAAMRPTVERPGVHSALTEKLIADPIQLFHHFFDLLSSPISHDCVLSGITGHNLTPEKCDILNAPSYNPHFVNAQSST